MKDAGCEYEGKIYFYLSSLFSKEVTDLLCLRAHSPHPLDPEDAVGGESDGASGALAPGGQGKAA
jgi:hypothetical protein